jgi:hypothetical protein
MNEQMRTLGILARNYKGMLHGDAVINGGWEFDIEFPNAFSAVSFCQVDFRELVPNFEHYRLRDEIKTLNSPVVVIVRCYQSVSFRFNG